MSNPTAAEREPAVRVVEVGPRDGLQNQPAIVPTEAKIAFIDLLSASGLRDIEVSSFVSPLWVPQLADAAQVFAGIRRAPGVRYSALVPNEAGLDRAIAARVDKVAIFVAASETFSRRNVNASIRESLERAARVTRRAMVPVRGYVSTAFYCPYEGPIAPATTVAVAQQLVDAGCAEVSIGDTIGRAGPEEVRDLLTHLLPVLTGVEVALHFHDTSGRAIANVAAAREFGIRIFDGSAGGLGGCPFAPGAPGNVSTQALVRAFPEQTGIVLEALERATTFLTPHVQGA